MPDRKQEKDKADPTHVAGNINCEPRRATEPNGSLSHHIAVQVSDGLERLVEVNIYDLHGTRHDHLLTLVAPPLQRREATLLFCVVASVLPPRAHIQQRAHHPPANLYPFVGRALPPMSRSSVDLPAPFGPTTPTMRSGNEFLHSALG